MKPLAKTLRHRMEAAEIRYRDADAFALMLAACRVCCEVIDGGNKTCPPQDEEGPFIENP